MPLGVYETREHLANNQISVVQHVESVFHDIRETDGELNAFVCTVEDEALRAAERADALVRENGASAWYTHPLLGVTVAVKDLIQTSDAPTNRGSMLANPRPMLDAPAVARLRAAGAIIVGKTTTSEHGWSASTVSPVSEPTANPWDPRRSAGGSSGGSAAAVSAGLCSAALGTDGAGSVRIPAAFCGVVGFKPSFGAVPYVPPCADRLAHLGPLGSSVHDVRALYSVIAGVHPGDPDSWNVPATPPERRLRIGWLEFPGTEPETRRLSDLAALALADLGHRVERIEIPFPDPYPALVDLIAAAEAAGTTEDEEQWADPGRVAVIHYGRSRDAASVLRAEEVRLRLRTTLAEVMERHDLLGMPTVPVEPFDRAAIGPEWASDPRDLRWLAWSPATYPFNLTGQPALSLPAGLTVSGLPVGVQLVGRTGADHAVLDTGLALERVLGRLPTPPHRSPEKAVP